MNRKLIKFSTLSALALSLVMWGCDSLTESALTGPGSHSESLIAGTSKKGYTYAYETDPTVMTVSAVMTRHGGAMSIGRHFLTVPEGAVDAPTVFTITRLDDAFKVDLTATRGFRNDVGHAGFKVPVTLRIDYKRVSVSDPSKVKVVWLKPDGTAEAQPTEVDTRGKFAIGTLHHFSAYDLAWPTD